VADSDEHRTDVEVEHFGLLVVQLFRWVARFVAGQFHVVDALLGRAVHLQ